MSTATHPPAVAAAPLPPPSEVYRLTVDQFDRMVRDGTLGEDEPVELLNGVLVKTMPKNPAHRVGLRKTILALQKLIPAGWHVAKEESLTVGPGCKWEPDAAVLRAELEFDASRDATAADCCLVIEVSDTSLARDRTEKLAGYARAGVPVYWIVNLVDGRVEVHANPDLATGRYLDHATYRPGDSTPVVVDGREAGRIDAADLLP
ncbi:MAG: Uma2 family endonuclease [Paludisphaera borealis]|uniref:Uma2 family endonuclease n=1 Tax=Paludisphaera borealis TaxID=1387353 RepID=UPI0028447BFC|nr:Uma2 family endonuclease [Paludisphaera borealis]MDR3621162.1 Uma2 family endonuclease [Paludisphaera borealis]